MYAMRGRWRGGRLAEVDWESDEAVSCEGKAHVTGQEGSGKCDKVTLL